MKFLKTYELFGFGSKKPKTWKDRFNDIYNFYIKNKNKKISAMDIPHADVKKDEVSISQGFDNHLVFYAQTGLNHNWEVLDFSEVDYADTKSTKGVYKITPEIYVLIFFTIKVYINFFYSMKYSTFVRLNLKNYGIIWSIFNTYVCDFFHSSCHTWLDRIHFS